MTPADAAKLLELPDNASPEQIEARFLELRRKLEDKIAKAPTPGLQAKYRESLTEVTTAFETLALAADSSSLPVLKKEAGEGRPEAGGPAPGGHSLGDGRSRRAAGDGGAATPPRGPDSGFRSQVSGLPPPKKTKSGREFLLVAIIAVVVLAAGGWWVMKTRAENAEKARIAAEAKAEAERQAEAARQAAEAKRQADEAKRQADEEEKARVAAAKEAERERQDRLLTTLRGRIAELNVAYDAAMRSEQIAERELAEKKSQERELKGQVTPQARRVAAEVLAQGALVDWLRASLQEHPARVAKARADELLAARAAVEAAAAVEAYAAAVEQLKGYIAARRQANVVTGRVELTANLAETSWTLTDAFGVEHSGVTPAMPENIAFGPARVVFTHPRQPAREGTLTVASAGVPRMHAEFPVGALTLASNLAGTTWKLTDAHGVERSGAAPAEVPEIAPGAATVLFSHPDWPAVTRQVEVAAGATVAATAKFAPAVLTVRVTPADATLAVDGVARQPDGTWALMPGEYILRATKAGLGPQLRAVKAGVNETLDLAVDLKPDLSPRIVAMLEQLLVQPGLEQKAFAQAAWGLSTVWYYTGNREKYAALMRICQSRLGDLLWDEKWTMVNIAFRASKLGLTEQARPLLTDRIDYEEISKYSGEKPDNIIKIGSQRAAFNLIMGNVAKARTIMTTAVADSRSADRWQHKIHEMTFDPANDQTNAETLYRLIFDYLMNWNGEHYPEIAQQYLTMIPAEYRAKVVAYAPGASVWTNVMIKFKRGEVAEALRSWEAAVENQHAANVRYKAKEPRVYNGTTGYLVAVLDFGHRDAVEPIRVLADRLIAEGKMLPHPTDVAGYLGLPAMANRYAADLSVAQFTRFAELERSPDPVKLLDLWLELRRYGLSL